jgi:riboflavin synthase
VFTGLVEAVGAVRASRPEAGGQVLEIELGAVAEGVRPGDSICVAGACLTVVVLRGSVAAFAVSPETLLRTGLGRLDAGAPVNLERSLRVGDRLGGPFLTGHVDATGRLLRIRRQEAFAEYRFEAPAGLRALLVEKGSVGVDGVSLTVARLHPDGFEVALIPETLARTTLGALREGASVHLEADLLAKHVARLAWCATQDPAALRAALSPLIGL